MNNLIQEKQKLVELIDKYEKNIDSYLNSNYNETELRVDFVNPFFEILGWDVENTKKLPPKSREVIHEATVKVEEKGYYKSKKPDYAFKSGTEVIFYLETKKPSIDISEDNQPAFQLRRYGWSGNLAISILTNFNDLYIYDCTVRPKNEDSNLIALIKHYNYKEYVEKFEEIYNFFSKQAVLSGLFEKQTENLKNIQQKESFDNYFLSQIKKWRLQLGESILKSNCIVDNESLNIFVQRILNRILFLRICEDRKLEIYETLKNVNSYEELKQLFINADKKYNSGLFNIIENEKILVEDVVIISIFQELYYPKSPYEFSVVDSYIIGQIYELFLDEILVIESGCVKIQSKTDVVDIQGSVNTPKNITDVIVEKSLDSWIQNHSHKEIQNIRIADICCGSGNFLISAYEYLINYYVFYYKNHNLEENLQTGKIFYSNTKKDYLLSLKEKKEILQKNIYGCDIDPIACEVAKFSLLLKTIEDIPEVEIENLYSVHKEKALPSLEHNIKNGNSLIDDKYLTFNNSIYTNIELAKKINIFNWPSEFPTGKFDVIIGNPPYIRVQKMVHFAEEEYSYYKSPISGYMTAETELPDKYYLFVERIMELLTVDGISGLIIPHKFMLIKSGQILRKILTKNNSIKEIIHFGTQQIFKGRDTYTCILIFSKKEQNTFNISFVNQLNSFLFNHETQKKCFPAEYITESPWVFLPDEIEQKLQELSSTTLKLNEIADIFVGLQTSNDNVYILKPDFEDENYIYCKEKDGSLFSIEKAILRKSIYDIQLHAYEDINANSYMIYPYEEINEKPVLYSLDKMKTVYPKTYEYLLKHKAELDKRSIANRNENNWYQFGRSQSLKRFTKGEHLIWAVLSLSGNYVFDDSLVTFTGGGNGPFYGLEIKKNKQYSILYVQALLNHWLLELIVKNKASKFGGDYYSHGKQFIAELPIKSIDFENNKEREIHDSIVAKSKSIMNLYKEKGKYQIVSQKDVIERLIQSEKKSLELMIDNLYGVSELNPKEDI